MMSIQRDGFTLIELSIVLVIIGLLAAGILVGRDLINAAELRAAIKQLEKYDTAVNTFRTKFNCLPGDCFNAESFGLGTAGAVGHNGDGNGIIGTTANVEEWKSDEGPNFWFHLNRANMVAENVSGSSGDDAFTAAEPAPFFALNAVNKDTGERARVWVFNGLNLTLPAAALYTNVVRPHAFYIVPKLVNGVPLGASSLLPTELYQIDLKIDDGLPMSGNVAASGPMAVYPMAIQAAPHATVAQDAMACVSMNPPYAYNLYNSGNRTCGAVARMNF